MTIDQESNNSYELIYTTDYTESLKKSHKIVATVPDHSHISILIPKSQEQTKLEEILVKKKEQLQELKENLAKSSIEFTKTSKHTDSTVLYKKYIDKLHKYNEIKDATQCLLGKLAEINKCTINEMHSNYGLPISTK